MLGIAYMVGAGLSLLLFVDFLYQHIKQYQWKQKRKQEVMQNASPHVQMVNVNRNGMSFVPSAF